MDQEPHTLNKPSSPSKKIVGIFVILLFLVVVAYGIYLLEQDNGPANGNVNSVANANSQSNTNTAGNLNSTVIIDTSDWKTYENTKYGYSFKYPANWQFLSPSESTPDPEAYSISFGDPVSKEGNLILGVDGMPNCGSLKECATKANTLSDTTASQELVETTLDDKEAYKVDFHDSINSAITLYFMSGQTMMRLNYGIHGEKLTIINTLLSTFEIN